MDFLSKRSMQVLGGLFLVLLIAGVGTYYIFLSPTGWKARQRADLSKVEQGDRVAYTLLDGSTVELSDFRGKVLVVNVWASWSPYTQADHAILNTIAQTYGDRITIVALDRKETKETAMAYLDVIGKQEGLVYVIDTTDHFFNSLQGYAMPETIVFDQVGNEQFRKRGVLDEAELRSVLDSTLTK